MDVKDVHSEKQYFPNTDVTDDGIFMDVKELQFENLLLVDYQYYTF